MKTIVTALDFSDASPLVLKSACQMASVHGATLHIIHVMEPEPTYAAYGLTPEEFPAIHIFRDVAMKRAEARINNAVSEARKLLPDVRADIIIGTPLHSIIDYAEKNHADLIVIGTHGHGAIAALLIGSVAEGLVRKAVCPTLVIPCHTPKE